MQDNTPLKEAGESIEKKYQELLAICEMIVDIDDQISKTIEQYANSTSEKDHLILNISGTMLTETMVEYIAELRNIVRG